ncbi:MAG: hypothetical protein LH609_17030 [Rudanella sp.]|nr:hypothetical protein [Rudanella sp.]
MAHQLTISPPSEPIRADSLEINFDHKQVHFSVAGFMFADHGYTVIYLPGLNLSAYGNDAEEAKAMLTDIVLDDFCENLVDLPPITAYEHLSRLGWTATDSDSKHFSNSAYVDKDGVLRNFDLPQNTPIQEQVVSF